MIMLDDKVRAIDSETIAVLFRNQPLRTGKYSEWREDWWYLKSKRPEQLLDHSFYAPLNERLAGLMPLQEKTKREVVIKSESSLINGESRQVPINNFLMSSLGGRGGKSIEYLPDIRRCKQREAITLYENSWVQPLPTLDAIQKRQQVLHELVNDKPYADRIEALAQSLNNMLLPHLHLSALSKLLASNALGSSRSGSIHTRDQDAFYQDYLRFCGEFVNWYEKTNILSSGFQPTSKDMKGIVGGICSILAESPIASSYKLARDMLDDIPASYSGLRERLMRTISGKPLASKERLEKLAENIRAANKRREQEPWDWRDRRSSVPKVLKKVKEWSIEKKYMNSYLIAEQTRRFEYFLEKPHLSVSWPFAQSDSAIVSINRLANQLVVAVSHAEYIRNNSGNPGWTLPEILPKGKGIIEIKNGWYPLTTLEKGEKFTPNDTYLSNQQRVEILDGTNRGGKTIDMRKTAFAVICALAGNYVPAEEGTRISYFDEVYIRLKGSGLNDQSALEQEINATGNVLAKIKSLSAVLVCIDEPWSSTNPNEGEAMTYGLVRRIAEMPTARGIFAIHYPQLRHHSLGIKEVSHSHFEYQEAGGEIQTNNLKLPGPNPQPGYAFAMARAENLHPQVLHHAISLYRRSLHGK